MNFYDVTATMNRGTAPFKSSSEQIIVGSTPASLSAFSRSLSKFVVMTTRTNPFCIKLAIARCAFVRNFPPLCNIISIGLDVSMKDRSTLVRCRSELIEKAGVTRISSEFFVVPLRPIPLFSHTTETSNPSYQVEGYFPACRYLGRSGDARAKKKGINASIFVHGKSNSGRGVDHGIPACSKIRNASPVKTIYRYAS